MQTGGARFMSMFSCCAGTCRLWLRVSDAIVCADQQAATQEKLFLEEEQRKLARERKMKMIEWVPRLFEQNHLTGEWVYKYAE